MPRRMVSVTREVEVPDLERVARCERLPEFGYAWVDIHKPLPSLHIMHGMIEWGLYYCFYCDTVWCDGLYGTILSY